MLTLRHRTTRTRALLLAGTLIASLTSAASAQIYSNTFSGGASNLNQKAPTLATDNDGAAASATWRDAANTTMLYQDGSVNTTAGDSVLLPFTPEKGFVYTLTASVTFTGNPGSWVGAGFAQYYGISGAGNAQFNQAGVNGYDWAILTESTGNLQVFAGPSTTGQQFNQNAFFTAGTGTHTLTITLNTTGTNWTYSCAVDGSTAGSWTYSTQPQITAVGITQHTLTSDTVVHWNSISLSATGTRATNAVSATVSFSGTTIPIPSNFIGLSYEKQDLVTGFLNNADTNLINLFGLLGPAVLRVGGGTVDTTGWNGINGTTPITSAEVDTFANFVNSLPANWSVIYGINLEKNTPSNAEAEAAYAYGDLGSRLLGFELGNEPEFYGWTPSTFLTNWESEESAITGSVSGWDHGTGAGGWMVDGADAGQGQLSAYTDPFASSESGVASLLTQHYYEGSTGTMQAILVAPNSTLTNLANNIATNASGNQALGSRITETGSIAAGGVLGVSNALGGAFWALDFMFTAASKGVKGVNFHGGGRSPYSPINDDGTNVTNVGPEFYASKLFQLIPSGGSYIPSTVALSPSSVNFSAYGVKASSGKITAVLNNKEVNDTVSVSLNVGAGVTSVHLITLTAPNLFDSTGLTLGGQPISTSGTWTGGTQSILSASNGQLTVSVPPITTYLLIPQ